jgi:hypothetical protein
MIELIIFNSLLIFGVYSALQKGMILEKLGDKIDELPEFYRKPLMSCPICMASVYGFPVYWGFYLLNPSNIFIAIIIYICYTFALAGLNYIISSVLKK